MISSHKTKGNVLIHPFYQSLMNDEAFNPDTHLLNKQISLMYRLVAQEFRNKGWEVHTIGKMDQDKADIRLYYDLNLLDKYRKELKSDKCNYLILFECSIINPFSYKKKQHDKFQKVFTWSTKLQGEKYIHIKPPQMIIKQAKKDISFNEKKFMVIINSNRIVIHENELYSERVEAIKHFNKKIDVYGPGWGKTGLSILNLQHVLRNLWRLDLKRIKFLWSFFFSPLKVINSMGSVKEAVDTYAKYKFCICYENFDNDEGYLSEKIFNAMNARCIPVYLGNRSVHKLIPKECFIDKREFSSYPELEKYLDEMTEEEYGSRINSINKFLNSPEAWEFSTQIFAEKIVGEIEKEVHKN